MRTKTTGALIHERLVQINMSQAELARKAGEHTQTISAIIREERSITIPLSLKLDAALGFGPGYLAVAQTRFQVEKEKQKQQGSRVQQQIRKILEKIKANGGLWSYDGIPDKLNEDAVIEAALMHLELEEMPLVFKVWSRAHVKRIWKERLVSQGSRLGVLNYILAVKVFTINNPDQYLSRNANARYHS